MATRFTLPPDARSILGHADSGPEDAQPPYLVQTVDFLFIGMVFEPGAIVRALPAGLEPLESCSGYFGLYSAPTGWGLAPYSAFFVAIGVKGYDSPDGSPAYFMAEGYYSGRAGRIMHERYNRRLQPGYSRQWREGGTYCGEGGPVGAPVITLGVREVAPAEEVTAGVHHYLGVDRGGNLNIYSVAYSGEFRLAEVVRLDFAEHASPLLRSLRPIGAPWASLIPAAPLTFSPPRPLLGSSQTAYDSAQVALLDLLSRIGQPVALVTQHGRVLFYNERAGRLFGEAFRSRVLPAWHHADRQLLDNAVARVVDGGVTRLPPPIPIEEPETGRPILVQALPVSAALAGERAALLLFSDPLSSGRSDTATTLQLLGLTPAEARLANLVGAGVSVPQAAESLSITDNTARSVLKIVYDKLGLSKQTELARIVTRLESLAPPADQGLV